MLRVISGSFRGLKLESLPGEDTRPTLDRVKEALFSMLFGHTCDASGLDLFAGSGALGIELMSRGGKDCVFVDSSPDAIKVVGANVARARISDKVSIVREDALSYIQRTDKKFDIIFLDPPYASGLYRNVLDIIGKRQLLNPGGLVVCECSNDGSLACPDGYIALKDKSYGKVRLLVLEEA